MSQLIHPRKMLQRPFGHMRRNVVAYLALFVALGGTSAYAANEWNSSNIQNETLLSEDIKNGTLQAADYGIGSVSGARIQDNNVTTLDLADGAIFGNDVRDGSLTGADVSDNSLTGTDINESSLNLPPTTTATFASTAADDLPNDGSLKKVLSRNLPSGSYAIVATANFDSRVNDNPQGDEPNFTRCELRNGNAFIGDALDRRLARQSDFVQTSLSPNGGAQVPAGGGEVSLWCSGGQGHSTSNIHGAQMMIIRLDGFF